MRPSFKWLFAISLPISILFHRELKRNQNPVLLDEATLNSFLQPDELAIFEELTKGFEIKQS